MNQLPLVMPVKSPQLTLGSCHFEASHFLNLKVYMRAYSNLSPQETGFKLCKGHKQNRIDDL